MGTGWYGRYLRLLSFDRMSLTCRCSSWASRYRTSSSWDPSSRRSTRTTVVARLPTRTLPRRSRISPRTGWIGTRRTWLSFARFANFGEASTCRNHRRVVSPLNMNTTRTPRTFRRVRVLVSLIGRSPSEDLLRARGLRDAADDRIEDRRQDRVVETGEQGRAGQVTAPDLDPQEERDRAVEQD